MSEIKKASCSVSFVTVNGYESRAGSQNKPGVTALLWALDEIGRVMTVDGQTDAAREALEAAIQRTQSDLKERGPVMSNSPAPTTEESEQFELLPCPFCGGKAHLVEESIHDHLGRSQVECTICRTGTWYWEAEVCVREWNRRTAPDVRTIALKEAADIADEMILYAGCDIANAIRALAAKKDET